LDLLIFTGGIGENDPVTRAECCSGLEYMGIEFDSARNEGIRGKEMLLNKPSSRVKVMTIPTNEELIIAEHTHRIVTV
jgi:acetate kinase